MDEENNGSDVNGNIADLMADPSYLDDMSPQHKGTISKLSALYKRRAAADGGGSESPGGPFGSGDDSTFAGGESGGTQGSRGSRKSSDSKDDSRRQLSSELERLTDLGVDVSNEDIDDIAPEHIAGLQHLRLIEEGNFTELSPKLGNAAMRSGMSVEEVGFLHNYCKNVAKPNDELTKDILRVVVNHVYRNRPV